MIRRFLLLLLLAAVPAFAQNPDAVKYAPRAVLLLDATPGVEAVMPMVFTENGQQHIEYVPASKIKEFMDKGGKPIRMGDILQALGEATQRINQLQAENAKLWQAVTKDSPQTQTVVVQQQQSGAQPSAEEIAAQQRAEAQERRTQALQTWLLLQNASRPQTINLNYRNCTRFPALCTGN